MMCFKTKCTTECHKNYKAKWSPNQNMYSLSGKYVFIQYKGTEDKIWIAIAIVLVIAYGWALALVSRHWSSRVSRPGRMWTFVHKVATNRFPGTKASAATADATPSSAAPARPFAP